MTFRETISLLALTVTVNLNRFGWQFYFCKWESRARLEHFLAPAERSLIEVRFTQPEDWLFAVDRMRRRSVDNWRLDCANNWNCHRLIGSASIRLTKYVSFGRRWRNPVVEKIHNRSPKMKQCQHWRGVNLAVLPLQLFMIRDGKYLACE